MLTITWKITAIDCYPGASGMRNVAAVAHYRCDATDGEFAGSVYGTCGFPVPDGPIEGFTPFEQLTEQQVLGWVWAGGVDKDAVESAVAAQIEAAKNPPIVQPPLPWSM